MRDTTVVLPGGHSVRLIGDLLGESGWIEVFRRTIVNTPGWVESLLKVMKVKRSRYVHQLSLASINTLARNAFKERTAQTSYDDVKLLIKFRVTFSDLRDHRFNHNFNCENPLCSCGMEDESSEHFFLHCPLYLAQRSTLLSKISAIISSDVTVFPDEDLHHILIYGSNVYNSVSNRLILIETITFIRNSGRYTNLEAFS